MSKDLADFIENDQDDDDADDTDNDSATESDDYTPPPPPPPYTRQSPSAARTRATSDEHSANAIYAPSPPKLERRTRKRRIVDSDDDEDEEERPRAQRQQRAVAQRQARAKRLRQRTTTAAARSRADSSDDDDESSRDEVAALREPWMRSDDEYRAVRDARAQSRHMASTRERISTLAIEDKRVADDIRAFLTGRAYEPFNRRFERSIGSLAIALGRDGHRNTMQSMASAGAFAPIRALPAADDDPLRVGKQRCFYCCVRHQLSYVVRTWDPSLTDERRIGAAGAVCAQRFELLTSYHELRRRMVYSMQPEPSTALVAELMRALTALDVRSLEICDAAL